MEEIKKWNTNALELFAALLSTTETADVQNLIDQVKTVLQNITTMIHELSKQSESGEDIGEIIERELSGMDKAIEEAAARIEVKKSTQSFELATSDLTVFLQDMLSKSKASDSGIKLEVNEKILDACTALMKAIRDLVKKSRVLQGEIVALGRGSASATEFYKRNHQWTEGSIILLVIHIFFIDFYFALNLEGLISAAKNVAQGANFLV